MTLGSAVGALRMASWQAAMASVVSLSAMLRAEWTCRLASLMRSPAAPMFAGTRSMSPVAIASASQSAIGVCVE